MTKKEMEKRIEALEREVKSLKPEVHNHYHYEQPKVNQPIWPIPAYPNYPNYPWTIFSNDMACGTVQPVRQYTLTGDVF